MKLATFVYRGSEKIGAVVNGDTQVVDLAAADPSSPHFASMLALIDGGAVALGAARAASADAQASGDHLLALSDVTLLSPIPVPRRLRDCLVFEEHLKNSFRRASERTGRTYTIPDVWYEQPIYYKGNHFSVVGTDAEVRWPAYSQVMDYELELACIIGKGGADIAEDDALGHIFGYTVFNDFSARDAQLAEMPGQLGPAKGKDFDTGNALGPWIVTADEIGDPHDLTMIARVNGAEWSRGNSATMHHSFARIVSYLSQSERLVAGEVIGSGTVGNGCGLEHGNYLKAGDVIELEVGGIGVLRNRIAG